MNYVSDNKRFDFSMEYEIRSYSTLSESHEKYTVKEGVDFGQ